jgi:hypothetical protein
MLSKIHLIASAPDYIIVGLAHDLGKIPEFHARKYCTGDHPFLSAVFLSGIPEFSSLPDHSSLLKSINIHHMRVSKNDLLTNVLKESDASVRHDEVAQQATAYLESGGESKYEKYSSISETFHERLYEEKNLLAMLGMDVQNQDLKGYKPHRIDISAWFDGSAVLCALRESVNLVTAGSWTAVSMPCGLVFCGCVGLWKILNRVTPYNPVLFGAYGNMRAKYNILYSVVLKLSEEYSAIAIELLNPDQYACPVTIVSGNGKIIKSKDSSIRLIPFRAQALGVDTFELERGKSLTIRRMANVITPLDPQKREK